jgi:glutamate dehydrogenase/leucine dehydrogenase
MDGGAPKIDIPAPDVNTPSQIILRRWAGLWPGARTQARHGVGRQLPAAEPISSEALLELDVCVLFPAALENVITAPNAAAVKAKIVAELAAHIVAVARVYAAMKARGWA